MTEASRSGPHQINDQFVGRAEELRLLRQCADSSRTGRPWVVLVEGEPGIGKSALLRTFGAELDGFTVLRVAGDLAEADFAYGLLSQLLTRVPRNQRPTSRLLHGELSPMEPAARVGAALLEMFGELQGSGPVAIVVDDMQWVDKSSLRALSFALRRLYADRVLTVLAARPAEQDQDERDPQPWQALFAGHEWVAHVRLGGLNTSEVAELAAPSLPAGLPIGAAERLREHTDGHPLYLRTLLTDLPAAILARTDRPLPVPDSLAGTVRRQVGLLPAPSVALLQALAVLNVRCPLGMVADLVDVADPASSLEPLISTGLVQWWPSEPPSPVQIRHLLLRDAIYTTIPPVQRRSLHARAAAMVAESASWAHRVAAADRADSALSDELESASNDLMRQGQVLRAVTYLQWASDLSELREDRERRLLTSVAHLLCSLNIGIATPLRPAAEACAPSALRTYVLGMYAVTRGSFAEAEGLLGDDLDSKSDLPRDILAMTRASLSCSYMWQGRGDDSVREARRVLSFGLREHHVGAVAKGFAIIGTLLSHGPDATAEIFDEVELPKLAMDVAPIDAYALAYRGATHMLSGELAAAESDLTTAARLSPSGPIVEADVMSSFWLAQTQYLLGAWDLAAISAERAVAHGSTVEMPSTHAPTNAIAALILSGRGDWERAAERSRAAQTWTEMLGPPQYAVFTGLAGAAYAQAKGNFDAMCAELSPLQQFAGIGGWPALYEAWWRPLLVEGLIGSGRLDEADAALDRLRRIEQRLPYVRVATAWLGGWLLHQRGDLSAARVRYEVGAAIPETEEDVPIFRARLEHGLSRLLLQMRERQSGAAALTRAHARYVALGARPFVERAAAELSTLGVGEAPKSSELLPFTERERDIANLVVRGMTNQEIASELYISAKTVEYHLGNIFTRLGISSRRQLSGMLSRRPAAASTAMA